jgi:DNA-binding CsgD family transcriptional regulator/sugar-specific transcriptional regulator TrmB
VLEELGLDSRAEAVYRLMLINRAWGVSEIAVSLGIPESEVRESLSRLAELALLRQSLDAPDRMHPVNPEVGLQLLLGRQHAEVLERQQRLAESRAAVSQLITDYTTVQPVGVPDGAERLDGMDAIQLRLEELAWGAASVCLSFMPGGAQSPQSLAASRPLDEQMLRRGISVLTVYLASVRNDPATLGYARWLTELGGEVRTVPTLPLRMVLFDHAVALVPIDLDNTRRGAVQLTVPGAIAALIALFEQVWQSAVPLGDESKRADGDLMSEERELLRLLSQGLTDEVAARQLGISIRTERRMVAEIMRRLGARSRFEAGMRASERNWISP